MVEGCISGDNNLENIEKDQDTWKVRLSEEDFKRLILDVQDVQRSGMMPVKLIELSISGYKTIRSLTGFRPQALNVLIGANGAGKSNFISFFRMLQWMLTPPGQLQLYVGDSGGASKFLHDGPAVTPQMSGYLKLETETGTNEYSFRLSHAAGDTFRFAEEKYRYANHRMGGQPEWKVMDPGVAEAGLNARAEAGDPTARTINRLIRHCVVYQFHNTSATARMKQRWSIDDGRWLKEDAANIAPFLLRLREDVPGAYQRIVTTMRQVLPFFADFVLEPRGETVLLQWRELGSDIDFTASQASDGMLRFIALASLLLQPEQDLPDVLLVDEPELGLHPHGCEVIAGLLRAASKTRQVFVATQSTLLVDQFAPEEVVVINRPGRASEFRRLSSAELKDWLEDFEGGRGYSLSELWEKNVFGGGPLQ